MLQQETERLGTTEKITVKGKLLLAWESEMYMSYIPEWSEMEYFQLQKI